MTGARTGHRGDTRRTNTDFMSENQVEDAASIDRRDRRVPAYIRQTEQNCSAIMTGICVIPNVKYLGAHHRVKTELSYSMCLILQNTQTLKTFDLTC